MTHHKDKLQEYASKSSNGYSLSERTGKLACFEIITEASGQIRGKCCFGCRLFYAKPIFWTKHLEEDCTKKEEHKAYIKSILPDGVQLEKAIKDIELAGDSEDMKKLILENEALKKKLAKVEKELKITDEMYDNVSAENDHLKKAVIATTDRGIRRDMVHYLQKTPAENDDMADYIENCNWDLLLQTDSEAEYREYCREYWSGKPRKNEIHRYEEEDESDRTSEED
jgi:hypothetical protein